MIFNATTRDTERGMNVWRWKKDRRAEAIVDDIAGMLACREVVDPDGAVTQAYREMLFSAGAYLYSAETEFMTPDAAVEYVREHTRARVDRWRTVGRTVRG